MDIVRMDRQTRIKIQKAPKRTKKEHLRLVAGKKARVALKMNRSNESTKNKEVDENVETPIKQALEQLRDLEKNDDTGGGDASESLDFSSYLKEACSASSETSAI